MSRVALPSHTLDTWNAVQTSTRSTWTVQLLLSFLWCAVFTGGRQLTDTVPKNGWEVQVLAPLLHTWDLRQVTPLFKPVSSHLYIREQWLFLPHGEKGFSYECNVISILGMSPIQLSNFQYYHYG